MMITYTPNHIKLNILNCISDRSNGVFVRATEELLVHVKKVKGRFIMVVPSPVIVYI